MDRQIVYPGAIPLDTDILNLERNVMIAEGFIAQGAFGTGTQAWGLGCTPTSPASMSVLVGPGALVSSQVVDQNPFGSLAADTTDALMKVGINLTSTTLTLTAPSSSGQSINYLIEASFLEQDTTPVVLPYYNASNPAQPYTGPSNSGAAQNTQRIQRAQIQLKAGTPANTGTQTTPAVDSGWVGLYVVTVAYGQTTVTAGNISIYPAAPFVGGGALAKGRLINIQTFTTNGTYWSAPGASSVIIEAAGGGGSGGGTAATGSNQGAVSSGGGAGSIAVARFTSGFTGGLAVTVGAGGAAPASGQNNGNLGGTTAVGSLVSCPGGPGGVGGQATGNQIIVSPSGSGSAPSVSGGTPLYSAVGQSGAYGLLLPYSGGYYAGAGIGGISPLTAGASGPGAGGSGVTAPGQNSPAVAGVAGNAGLVVIYEYA
jgi:hypothetical protein